MSAGALLLAAVPGDRPGRGAFCNGKVVVPCGHQGVLLQKRGAEAVLAEC